MSITKEQLRSLIREQMNNVSEVADEYTPMMPPKPVKPKGIAGTDLPMSALSDGIDAVIKKLKEMYAPGSREYENVMNVLNLISKQGGLQESDVEEGLTRAQAAKAWEEMNQARRDREAKEKGLPADDSIDITDKPNQVGVTKEYLQRIIKEELEAALSEHGSERAWRRYKKRYGKNRTRDALGNRIVREPETDVDTGGHADYVRGRKDGEAGTDKPAGETEKYYAGYEEGKQTRTDLESLKGLEEASVNEQ